MLKKIRVALAVIFGLLITMLFLDISGVLHHYFAFAAKLQFVPALLALNAVVLIGLVVLTLLFGRVYCSVICPTGIFQDMVAFFARRVKAKKRRRYTYSKPKTILRWVVLTIFVIGLIAGIGVIPALLEPYSLYGRMVTELLSPLYSGVNNLFVKALGDGSYTFVDVDIWMKSGISFALALLTLLVIGYLAWRSGRTYCNTICPVGTLLGYLSKLSFLKIHIDPSTCTQCGRCVRTCKASCLDVKNHIVDYSRCVSCFNCIDACRNNSVSYTGSWAKKRGTGKGEGQGVENASNSRRQFIATSLLIAGTAAELTAQDNKRSMIKYPAVRKERFNRLNPVTPPGSGGYEQLNDRCTACLLCVAKCPEKLIRPSVNEYGWEFVMQPTLSFEKGYCQTDCTICSDVCPTDAIQGITKENKTKTAIGRAVYVRENCVVVRDDVNCEACWRICPNDAITREYRDDGTPYVPPADNPNASTVNLRLVPVIDEDKCIGCGACEYICAARPLAAIHVEGYATHRLLT
ncbi:MAG: 4Fe-4S binding protein [Fermentimonas sp.]|jgi:ferredoxin